MVAQTVLVPVDEVNVTFAYLVGKSIMNADRVVEDVVFPLKVYEFGVFRFRTAVVVDTFTLSWK